MNEPRWRRYLRFHRQDSTADLDDEVRDHLQSTIDSLVASGMSLEGARAEAHRRFGDVGAVRSQVGVIDAKHDRDMRLSTWIDTVRADVVYALRQLVRAPVLTAVTAISIGLGVALNVTVFSIANGLILRPLPGARTDGLVRVYVNHHSGFEYPVLDWLRTRTTTLTSLIGEAPLAMPLDVNGSPERIVAAVVTRGYFGTLGVTLALGRGFDDRQPEEAVAVLSHATWKSRFGGDTAIIGRTIRLADRPFTVIGVAPPSFLSSVVVWAPELWIPLAQSRAFTGVAADSFPGTLYVTGTLRSRVTRKAADAELGTLARQLAATDSARYRQLVFRTDHMRGVNAEVRQGFTVASAFMLTMVLLVLAIACANVANLLLGRAVARRSEIGVRLALGASRRRLVRQLLTESLVLAVTGGALGLTASYAVLRVVMSMVPTIAGLSINFSPDADVFVYAGLLCVASALLFGLVPALRASSPHLASILRRDADGLARSRLRGILVGGQVAMTVVLLAVAIVLGRSFVSSRGVDPGFNARNVLDVAFDLGRSRSSEQGTALYDRITDALVATPGVENVALANLVPLSGNSSGSGFIPEGMEEGGRELWPVTDLNVVGPGYLSMLGIRLTAGREFQKTDVASAARVAIVNEAAARRWWPGANAVGKRLRVGWGSDGVEHLVVGVARDAKYRTYGEDPRPFVYLASGQHYRTEMIAHVRVRGDAAATRAALLAAVRTLDRALPPPSITPMSDEIAMALFPTRFGALLLSSFGAIALLIASAGIYGVTSYAVSRRTREIGIRVALGAQRGRVLRLIILESMRTVGVGGLIGLTLSVGASVLLSRFLFGVTPVEPAMLVGVPAILALVAFVASWLPARRAARVDPLIAIRSD